MFLFGDNFVYDLILLFVTLLTGVVFYYKWSFTYWKRKGLEHLEPSIPFGNTGKLFTMRSSVAEQFAEFYKEFRKRGLRHGGAYMLSRPFYIPVDIEIVKNIMQRDFGHFVDRGFYVNEEVDPLSGHLFNLEGSKWRDLRMKLTATFTSGKMKMMFETMAQCAEGLDFVMNGVAEKKLPVEIKDTLARFTTDVITSCAFGLESNCLKNPDTPFRHYGKRIVENTPLENLQVLIQFCLPQSLLRFINFKVMKPDVEDFIMNVVKKNVDYREKNNIYRKDFMHLLLQLKNRGKISDDELIVENGTSDKKPKEVGLTVNELAAQVFVFFAGGYETSSTAMTFTLYELALHQEIQDKLRKEIVTVLEKHSNKVTYDAIMEMTYMDQVLNESLRKYPPLAFLNRKCTKAYDVPNTKLRLDEGTLLVIPILGIHYDPEYYPNPEKFDPERFSDENKKRRPAFSWLPFGEGPRICIGMRFGVLQSKIGLTTLLRNYRVTLNEKTTRPLKMNSTNIITSTKDGIWLNVEKLN